ncbi:MAG: transposase family protein [bacterium]
MGIIDGTLRQMCRPKYYQKQTYSGHKRAHGLKYQAVVTPDGFIACLHGPINGNRHDSYMLRESNLLTDLRAMLPHENGILYRLYGDPAYPNSPYIIGRFRHARPGTNEAAWNTNMSKVREVVEWGFKDIIQQWAFVDFKVAMKMYKMDVAKYYKVAAFLTNLRNCFYGSEASSYFGCNPMSLNSYLNLPGNGEA